MPATPKSTPRTRRATYQSQQRRNKTLVNVQEDQDSPSEAETTIDSPGPITRGKSKSRSTIPTTPSTKLPSRLGTPNSSKDAIAKRVIPLRAISASTPPRTSSMSSSAASARSPPAAASPAPGRKSGADRRREIELHECSGSVEPTRALCIRCGEWVPLSDKTPYATRPWYAHVKKCAMLLSSPIKSPLKRRGFPSVNDETEHSDAGDTVSVTAPPSTSAVSASVEPEHRRNMSEAQRRAFLKADPRAVEVRPHEVLCHTCRIWVKLGTKDKYMIAKWAEHQVQCSGTRPSDRVLSAERKLKLVNDPQAKAFTAYEVECRTCNQRIGLTGGGEYNLTVWNEHKSTCSATQTDAVMPESAVPPGVAAPSTEEATPLSPTAHHDIAPSVASTDDTVAVEPQPSPSRKRKRDDEDTVVDSEVKRGAAADVVVPETRPAIRPRTETFKPVDEPTPGVWDRLMVPWRTFVQGFYEGLRGGQQ